jgi:aspartyl-tRNA(Asn)/glutamyl-tRNA(Gln) amidotransferase subunit A
LRLGVLNMVVMDQLDPEVSDDFSRSVSGLRSAGVVVEILEFDMLKSLPLLLKQGGIVGAEAHAVHRDRIASHGSEYDPRVSGRIALAGATSASDYIALKQECQNLITVFAEITRGFDAVILPTVANVAPRISDIDSDETYFRLNGLSLRNTYVANILDGCAISMPMNREGHAPTGMMVMARHGQDQSLFSVANAIAALL